MQRNAEVGLFTKPSNLNFYLKVKIAAGGFTVDLVGALAEFERNPLRECTQARLLAARARGRKGGRPKTLRADQRLLAVPVYDEKKYTVDQICQMMGISKASLYKYIQGAREVESKPRVHFRMQNDSAIWGTMGDIREDNSSSMHGG